MDRTASKLNGFAYDLNVKLETDDSVKLSLMSNCCIYKVPPKLRKVSEEAYTPTVVSIGPYHYGDIRLESMNETKVCYVRRFLKRTTENSLEDYFEALKDKEDEIRGCYSETIQMESNEFVSMIFADACFIIEFFLAFKGREGDPLVKKIWPTTYIKLDLILLENQLPFFVLTCLFDLAFPSGFNGEHSFVNLTYDFFEECFLLDIYPNDYRHPNFKNIFNRNSLDQVQHLCDVLRAFYLPSDLPVRCSCAAVSRSISVSQLREAGMKFQVHQKSSVTRLQCSRKVLKIPHILISDSTETILRNVVALEQCHCPSSGYVTDYVMLLDDLIDSGKDVEILVGNKIMDNWLGDSNEVASMVNKLGINVHLPNINHEYCSLYKKVNRLRKKNCNCHRYMAIFVREYWSTPWKIASVIAATFLLLFTLIQTICSVKSSFITPNS